MIGAYQARHSRQRQAFPDGAGWRRSIGKRRRDADALLDDVPGELDDVDFMVKDSKKFAMAADGLCPVNYNRASDTSRRLEAAPNAGTASIR